MDDALINLDRFEEVLKQKQLQEKILPTIVEKLMNGLQELQEAINLVKIKNHSIL